MNRTATTSVAGRSSAMRRLRRRNHAATSLRPYCGTNGCASFLEVDPTTGVARCPICGYQRRPH